MLHENIIWFFTEFQGVVFVGFEVTLVFVLGVPRVAAVVGGLIQKLRQEAEEKVTWGVVRGGFSLSQDGPLRADRYKFGVIHGL